ncbi:hypothetical protein HID58_086046, partial [Brassica napus]
MATEEEADEYNISEVDWGEEPGYSWEDQNYGDGSEESDQCRESWTKDGHEEEPCRKENYSRWEEGMENYFWEYRVPEHKKLSIALDALVGEAYQWWLQAEKCRIHFKEPTPDWEYVKGLMYEHFEMRRLPPRACPKPLVKLKPKKLHEHKVTKKFHFKSYDQFRLYVFSGRSEDPRNYLQWEEDTEKYFKCNSIPKGEYLSYDMATEEEADEYNISEVDWGEEPGYSWEDQNYGDGSEENDQCRESWTKDGHEEEPCHGELDSKPPDHYTSHTINKSYSKLWIKFTDKFYDNIPRVLTKTLVSFSGKENYSRWEEGMENYFWEYRVPEHKKLSIALDALVGEAYQWWLQAEKCRIHFKEPTPDWEYVKGLMYEHFEMRRLPPRACPKPLVKLKPKKLHEHKLTKKFHFKSYDQFRLYVFSGRSEDPRNYLQWEEDTEKYFKCNSIPKGEYLSYGLGQLTEKAQRYWNREE